ncbi:MAG: hypothetical protein QNJ46_05860 [Leptolyngbyaceae cyanobacterium MO_188.B28]|nr:hypothetical protein [Leptolyngbyaceae cyanobacterium MO_188.B28]
MADVIGIPSEIADDKPTRWETMLDNFEPGDYELLWFMKPTTASQFTDTFTSEAFGGGWETTIFLNTNSPTWEWQLKAREIETHIITAVASGELSVLVVLSELEAQLNAVRDALTAIGRGEVVQSYSIRGRSLSRFSLSELMDLFNLLKRELDAERTRKGRSFGYIHGNFGPSYNPYVGW